MDTHIHTYIPYLSIYIYIYVCVCVCVCVCKNLYANKYVENNLIITFKNFQIFSRRRLVLAPYFCYTNFFIYSCFLSSHFLLLL